MKNNAVLADIFKLINSTVRGQETIRVFLSGYIEKDVIIVTDNNTCYLKSTLPNNNIKEDYDKICFCGIDAYNILKDKFSEYIISELDNSMVVKYVVIKILKEYYNERK